MRINDDTRLKITENLLTLDKGEEFILTDYVNLRPLYIKKGKQYILQFLKAASELKTYKKITEVFPHEKDLLNTFLSYGILVPSWFKHSKPQNYFSKDPDLQNKRGISLYLLLSQSCNMKCVYCLDGQRTYQTDKNLRMNKGIAFKSIERCLDDIDQGGRLEVIFFGGEPLLNWPLAKEVIIHCEECLKEKHRDKKRQYHFTTNLSFLPTDLIEWAKKYDISFLCDIDGPPAIHNLCRPFKNGVGSYESTVRNIQLIRAAGLRIDLRATVTALNQDCLVDVAEHHKSIGGNSSAFVPVIPVNSDQCVLPEQLLPIPEKVINGMTNVYRSRLWKSSELFPFNQYALRFKPGAVTIVGCGAPYGNVPVVDVNGDVYPCIYLVGIKRFHLGNIMDASYPKRTLFKQMYDELHVDLMEDCKECSWRYICGGSCPVGRLTGIDNPMASAKIKTYFRKMRCDYTKSILELLLWEKVDETVSQCKDPAYIRSCV